MCETNTKRVAVYARDICFSYSSHSEPILDGINLTVGKSTIYGLLGANGSGKTTLLKCILGILKPNSGEISIFGKRPGSKECHIPGAGVGYMPQELSLFFEFNIQEVITYFAQIYAMNRREIKNKLKELISLLNLPDTNKLIGKLSNGQQRRVSMACALIHSPPLLILDEPTVGTDPVLRQNIWLYLVSLCKSGHTIIMTTHYIEEARNADTVAFMRNGKLLIEENPVVLLKTYDSIQLEEVFLKLCHLETKVSDQTNDNEIKVQGLCYENYENEMINDLNVKTNEPAGQHLDFNQSSINSIINNEIIFKYNSLRVRTKVEEFGSVYLLNWNRYDENEHGHQNNVIIPIRKSGFINKCSALLQKNFRRLIRNWGHLVFEVLLSSLLLLVMLVSIGDGPQHINLAIHDGEITTNSTNNWGKLFVEHIDKRRFNLEYFYSIEEAKASVKSGKNRVAINIDKRFTTALSMKYILGSTYEDSLEDSQIDVYIDRSNQMIGLYTELYLYETLIKFAEEAANRSYINVESVKLPLVFKQAIYGDRRETLREFVLPGIYIILTFFVAATIAAHMLLEERLSGLLERTYVAGVTVPQFLLSVILTQFCLLCILIFFLLLFPYLVLGHITPGSIPLFIAMILSQGFCGVAFGISVAFMVSQIIMAALVIISFFIISAFTSGVLWPVENMPFLMQMICKFLPNTIPIESMRNIVYRKWTLSYTEVYIGFIVSYVWFAIFIATALKCFRTKL